jgi:CBS domain-containing protein
MKVAGILKPKRETAEAVRPVEALQALAQRFRVEDVGAFIVRGEGGSLEGIITESDLARGLAIHGDQLPELPASALMTTRDRDVFARRQRRRHSAAHDPKAALPSPCQPVRSIDRCRQHWRRHEAPHG